VTLQRPSVEIIEADNPFMAAVIAAERYGDGVASTTETDQPDLDHPPTRRKSTIHPVQLHHER
jgi:hypothetical protein